MIDPADIEPGDILCADDDNLRTILVVHIQPHKSKNFPEWEYQMWWLPRTATDGSWDRIDGRPIGPWGFAGKIRWSKTKE